MTRRVLRPVVVQRRQCTHPQTLNRAQDAHSDILSCFARLPESVT